MNTHQITSYKRATAVVKDLKNLVDRNPLIRKNFLAYSGSSTRQLYNLLNESASPVIVPVLNLVSKNQLPVWGVFNAGYNPNAIRIRLNLINGLELAKLEGTIYNTGFLLAVTILHELIHYCRYHNKIDQKDNYYEYGSGFESYTFGSIIDDTNAYRFNKFRSSFSHLSYEIYKRSSNTPAHGSRL